MTDHRSSEQLMNDAKETRADIDAILAELEDRMSPERLANYVGQALLPARTGTLRFARNLGASAQDNPVAATLAAVGLGWLMMSRRRDPGYLETEYAPYRRADLNEDLGDEADDRLDPGRPGSEQRSSIIMPGEEHAMDQRQTILRPGLDPDAVVTPGAGPYAGVGQHAERLIMPEESGSRTDDIRKAGSRARERARDVRDRARQRADDIRHRARERAEDVAGRLSERSDEAYRRASDAAHRAGTRVRETSSDVGDFVRERPMLTGFVLAGLGAVVAATVFARSDRGRDAIHRSSRSVRDGSRRVGERVRKEVDSRRDSVSEAGATARQTLKDVDERIKDTAERARSRAQSMATSIGAADPELPGNAPSTGSGYRLSPEDAAVSAPEPHTTQAYGTAAPSALHEAANADSGPSINTPQPVKPVPVTPPRSSGDGEASSEPGLPPKLDSMADESPRPETGEKPENDWKGTDTLSKTGGLGGATRDGHIG